MEIFENFICSSCNKNTTCIEQPHCEHILCMNCFEITYYVSDSCCPICNISTNEIYKNKTNTN